MCCLRYEHEHYKLSQKQLPAVGAILQLDNCKAKVLDVNVISNMITVETEEEVQLHIHSSQVKLEGTCRRHGIACNMTEKNCQCLIPDDSIALVPDTDDEVDDEIVEEILKQDPESASLLDDIVETNADSGGVTFRAPREAPSRDQIQRHRGEEKSGNGSSGRDPDRSRRSNRNGRNNGGPTRHNNQKNGGAPRNRSESPEED
jgi:hypothetical protein